MSDTLFPNWRPSKDAEEKAARLNLAAEKAKPLTPSKKSFPKMISRGKLRQGITKVKEWDNFLETQ